MRFIYLICILTLFLNTTGFAKTEDSSYTEDKTGIAVKSEDPKFTIKLKSNPTTGYSWFLREYNSSLLQPVNHKFEMPGNTKLMGAPGYEVWTFRAKPSAFSVPQQTMIRFVYARPWESSEQQAKQSVFRVSTIENSKK